MIEFDPHTHSIASGHVSSATITEMAKQASSIGLKMLGITDHGPATISSCKPSYFRNLSLAPSKRFQIDVFYGAEVNILNANGDLDLPDEILSSLKYAIASIHTPILKPASRYSNTLAYINAMQHNKVKIIGHCDDARYEVDYNLLIQKAIQNRVLLEINNSSLSPNGYRGDTRNNVRKILELCRFYSHPIVLSSDSHGIEHIGDFQYSLKLIKEMNFPQELILNYSLQNFISFIQATV